MTAPDPMVAIFDALNWPLDLRPKPHPPKARNVDWETEIETRLFR